MKTSTSVLFLLIVSLSAVFGLSSQIKRLEMNKYFGTILNKSPGRLYNCGNPRTKLQFTMTPSKLDPRSGFIVNVSFIAPFDFKKGILNGTVWSDDQEIVPMFAVIQVIKCDQIKDIDQSVACPFKKGHFVSIYYRHDTTGLKGYTGKYILQIEIRTLDGKLALCGRGKLEIVPSTPY